MNTVYAFIDASNLFYGGEKSLGWRIDYKKLFNYLQSKYGCKRIFYFGGVEIYDYQFDYLKNEKINLAHLERYVERLLHNYPGTLKANQLKAHLQQIRFYLKLEEFGYELYLKPVKSYRQPDGIIKRKANCDVDMTFHMMKEKDQYCGAIILSGDGDFLPVLKHLRQSGKTINILSRGVRTAREIKQFAGSDFRDFGRLEQALKFSSGA